ncbi:hypothetical protein [Saccharothrix texasensis]|uniref:hypothetical protein n=1 Tax=Saccharothrix texasensis TaxID=103734 RepID=UPI0011CE1CE0|nr:hypothetical protein [Saccharothrix texasensis]
MSRYSFFAMVGWGSPMDVSGLEGFEGLTGECGQDEEVFSTAVFVLVGDCAPAGVWTRAPRR